MGVELPSLEERLVGVGFGSEGFDVSSYYRRTEDTFDARMAWMSDGIEPDERLGDFGLVGDGAGLEFDIYDASLGTPPEAVIVATSENHTDIYLEVLEELYFNVRTPAAPRTAASADDIVFPTPNGGAVCRRARSRTAARSRTTTTTTTSRSRPRTCSTASSPDESAPLAAGS